MATGIESILGNYLLNKLEAFAEEEVVMILGVKDELQKLERRMRHIGAFLKDAERRRITEGSINNWLNELKDVTYDADDMIDLWRYYDRSRSMDKPSSSSSNTQICCTFSFFPFSFLRCFGSIPLRHRIAMQIKKLDARLEQIFYDMSNLNLVQIKSEVHEVTSVDPRLSSPIIGVDVVGEEIDDGAKKIVRIAAMGNKHNFPVVAIIGMGGIGKTTLAQIIYNNPTIKNVYPIKIWLGVSQSFSPVQLIKEAIRNAGGNPGQAESESELLPMLVSTISGKSFFLVLDDVWNPDVWINLLQDPLKVNATQGFILVTTRDQRVALKMGAEHIHQATVLSPKSGWELLCKRAFVTDAEDCRNLKEVGTELVKKCGGLPLAIKVIAGTLATKSKRKRDWEYVLEKNAWSINGLPKEIDRALYLSYEDLSPPLKQCFLYCSLYPSNWNIYRCDLVEDWIAEGFVEETKDQTMEDIADEYYYELIGRHLLEPDPFLVDYNKSRMHDLLRDLAQYLTSEENFCGDQELPDATAISKLRRLSVTKTSENSFIPYQGNEPLKLRTFIIFNCYSQIENHMFERFKHLRVLYINEKGLTFIPELIGDLIHLRELDLDRTNISCLPESIGSLKNLLFLSLQDCELLRILPRGITRLFNLRHLILPGTSLISVPKGLGRLEKLTELWGFQIVGDGGHAKYQNGWDLQELEHLSQLRKIEISMLERARNDFSVFVSKTHLKVLGLLFSPVLDGNSGQMNELMNDNVQEILEKLCPPPCLENLYIQNYRGETFPSWLSLFSLRDLLPNLQSLQLAGWSSCKDLPPLGLLPNLNYLRVNSLAAIVKINSEFLGIRGWKGSNLPISFPKLEYLFFEDMPNWQEWVLSGFEGEISPSWQLMPRIKELGIVKCPKLRSLPEGLNQLRAVKELFIMGADSIRSIQDLPFECEMLVTSNNQSLEALSNLPRVKNLRIAYTPNLRLVSNLVSLEYLYLEDYKLGGLPEWLIELIEERKNQSENKLHLDLFCNSTLLKRCLKDGPDWQTIKCFSAVSAYGKERSAFLEYTREPESYYASL